MIVRRFAPFVVGVELIERTDRSLPAFCALATLVTLAWLSPAMAQYEDDTLDDQERQDRQYLERYKRQPQEDQPPSEDLDGEPNAAAFIALADELIRDKSYRSFSSERYRVQTDDPRLDPKAAAALLEAFFEQFDGFWDGAIPLHPSEAQSRVFLFYSFYKYNQLLDEDWRFSDVRPKGHYKRGVGAITLHTDADAAPDLSDALIHEATHQLVEELIYSDGAASSPWISEGLATYFGYTYMDRDKVFHPGEIGGKALALMRQGSDSPGHEGRDKLQTLKRSLKSKKEAIALTDVIRIRDPSAFYGQSNWTYAASWVLVHYALHADHGAHRDAFMRYVVAETEGQGGPQAFFRLLETTPDELETNATAYVKTLKAR
jgi:hypothetical protein